MEKKFIKVRSVKDIVIFTTILIIGLALVVFTKSVGAHIGGCTLIVSGVILSFLLKGAYKDEETGNIYYKQEFSFAAEMKKPILSALSSNPQSINLSEINKGQILKLTMYYSKGSGKAFLQLYEYIPHQYKPCSKMHQYELNRVEKFLKQSR